MQCLCCLRIGRGPRCAFYCSLRCALNNRLLLSVVASAVLLSGCVAADLVHLAVHSTEESFSIKYFPKLERGVAVEPSLKVVTAMPYKRHFLREEAKCQFDGVLVPWERTWPIPAQSDGEGGSTNMLPPEPGKIAGYAAVVYQRTCPNALPESILHVGVQGVGVFSKPFIIAANSVGTQDVLDTPIANRPQWLPQVLERLVGLASTDATAKRVVDVAQDKFVRALPEIAPAIQAVVK